MTISAACLLSVFTSVYAISPAIAAEVEINAAGDFRNVLENKDRKLHQALSLFQQGDTYSSFELFQGPVLRETRGIPFSEANATTEEEYLRQYRMPNIPSLLAHLETEWHEKLQREQGDGSTPPSYKYATDIFASPRESFHRRGNMFFASAFKLRHDAEQLYYLVKCGDLPAGFTELAKRYMHVSTTMRAVAANSLKRKNTKKYPAMQSAHIGFILSPPQVTYLQGTYNTLLKIFKPENELPLSSHNNPLNPKVVYNLADATFMSGLENNGFGISIMDNALKPDVMSQLRQFCLRSTIWYDVKDGSLVSHYFDGFSSGLVSSIASSLLASLPRSLIGLKLVNVWAFTYDSVYNYVTNKAAAAQAGTGGLGVHADNAAVNCNIWLTPSSSSGDERKNDGYGGGMVIHHVFRPKELEFAAYNSDTPKDRQRIKDYVRANGRKGSTVVNYRYGRLVCFNSSLFHESDNPTFQKGWENYRIGVTFLFA